MADQPQNPQSPNAGRISAMLQDLSTQRGDQPAASPALPPRPVAQPTVGGPPPVNLPIGQAPAAPVRVPAPAAPAPQQPVAAPKPPSLVPPAPPPVTVTVTVPSAAPVAPRPPVSAPPASAQPAGAIPPPRPAPPPAPREVAATVPPKPATPPPPPPPAPAVVPTTLPAPAAGPQYASELRTMSTDIGSMQVGQPPAAVRPVAVPVPAATPQAPAPAPQIIVIPPASSGGGSKKMLLFAGLGLLVLALVGVIVWAFFSGGGTQVAEETPTPSAAPILTPRERALSSYFGLPKATATITGTDTAVTDFRNALLTAQPAAKQATSIEVTRSGSPMTLSAFLAATLAVPADVSGSLGTDWVALAYGQTEAFDGSGQPLADAATEPSLALVLEVIDASKVNQAMQAWEGTDLDVAAEQLFGYLSENAIVPGFSSGTYREVPIRYRNFPYADNSLDWAMALGSNGKNYLILTGSREAAFFAIDQLMQ